MQVKRRAPTDREAGAGEQEKEYDLAMLASPRPVEGEA
jgi:hypothetical protein